MDLQELSDKLEINELLTRCARGVDSEDWEPVRRRRITPCPGSVRHGH
jgi:hypothetical protein